MNLLKKISENANLEYITRFLFAFAATAAVSTTGFALSVISGITAIILCALWDYFTDKIKPVNILSAIYGFLCFWPFYAVYDCLNLTKDIFPL